jgi:tripartite-type tricarboxylate transporter receptor subunit TctC
LRVAAALVGAIAFPSAIAAQSADEFYKGKQITIVAPAGAGGTYDHYSRLAAQFLGEHIPGNPRIIVQNMPGAGGATATNYVFNVAPRDGTVLMALHANALQAQLLGTPGVTYDIAQVTAIGQFTDFNSSISVIDTAPAKTIEEAKRIELVLGATGKSSVQYQVPVLMNAVLGTKFKVVSGYKGAQDQDLAMEQGELHGRVGSLVSWGVTRPDWIRDGRLRPLVQIGTTRAKDFAQVPLITELTAKDDERQMFMLLASGTILGQSLVGPPGLPADRAALLRAAFDKTVADPRLLAHVEKAKLEFDPRPARDLEAQIRRIHATPTAAVERVKTLVGVE